VLDLIQILTRSNAWVEAETLAATALGTIPDTTREAAVRLIFEMTNVATSFENALVRGDHIGAAALA
jgi:hypothetical protein